MWLLKLRVRQAVHRDQTHPIGDYVAALPPRHRLPWFQALFPSYDRYAGPLLTRFTQTSERPTLIDVGANVGDTALLALSASANLRVVAVEGDPYFLKYLRRNLRDLSRRTTIVESFVGSVDAAGLAYHSEGSTGGFTISNRSAPATPMLGVQDLLDMASGADRVIWKSDTDGLDISILADSWEIVDKRCSVIWFEFDPFLDVSRGSRTNELLEKIAATDRELLIFDNSGRRMFTTDASNAPALLGGLSEWMSVSAVPGDTSYLDVWLVDRRIYPS